MRNRIGLLALAVCAFSSYASAGLVVGSPSPSLSPVFGTLVNFDDQPTGNLLSPTQYAGVGVASIVDLNSADDPLGYFSGSQSPPNYIGTGPNDGWNADILITLVSATDQIGIGIAGPDTTTLTARDAFGNVIESDVLSVPSNAYYVVQDSSGSIASLELSSSFIAIDDLQFDPSSVSAPEPGSLGLLAGGVVLIALGRFRHRAAQGN